jgi:methionine-rich copper-binding protein CopC
MLLAILVTSGGPAAAHAELVDSSPPAGSTLGGVPVTIELMFSSSVKAAAVVLTAPHARRIELGQVRVDGARVTVPVKGKPKGDGGYTIAYRVVARDGHPVSGRVDFNVGGAGTGGLFGANLGVPVMVAIMLGSVGVGAVISSLVSRRKKNAK